MESVSTIIDFPEGNVVFQRREDGVAALRLENVVPTMTIDITKAHIRELLHKAYRREMKLHRKITTRALKELRRLLCTEGYDFTVDETECEPPFQRTWEMQGNQLRIHGEEMNTCIETYAECDYSDRSIAEALIHSTFDVRKEALLQAYVRAAEEIEGHMRRN